jgi:hypothetical protein
MRGLVVLTCVLGCVFQSQAASTVQGFAVATRWSGAFDYCWGNDWTQSTTGCRVTRFNIANGVVIDTPALYTGPANNAIINPDGQRVAFMRPGNGSSNQAAAICVMSASGGTPVDVVSDVSSGTRTFIDWPAGDWIYYGSSHPPETYYGWNEVWKVNVSTKATALVFKTNFQWAWQCKFTNDGLKCVIREQNGSQQSWRFALSDFPAGGTINVTSGDAYNFHSGCGTAISPDGAYTMIMDNLSHNQILFQRWDKSNVTTITLATMGSWGTQFGLGMNDGRWSCNDPKWIVVQCGIDGRGSDAGGNQALLNWIDHEQVRTTFNQASSDPNNKSSIEPGDFWVGTPTPMTTKAAIPHNQYSAGDQNSTITVFDMLGRQIKTGASLKRGVYFVQAHNGKTVQTRKVTIQK